MSNATDWDEKQYRAKIQETLAHIEGAFDQVDPDVAECEQQFGALTIKFPDGSRLILSAQPSVRQLWMAVASKGTAYHFNFDPARGQWLDDKDRGIEAVAFVRTYLREAAGLELAI